MEIPEEIINLVAEMNAKQNDGYVQAEVRRLLVGIRDYINQALVKTLELEQPYIEPQEVPERFVFDHDSGYFCKYCGKSVMYCQCKEKRHDN